MPNVGPLELIIVLVIVLLIFGPKRLPSLGRQLGGGMREFKDSLTGKSDADDDASADRPELSASEADTPSDARPAEQHAASADAPEQRG